MGQKTDGGTNQGPSRSVFRYVAATGAAVLVVVLLLGGLSVASLGGLMINERTFAKQILPLYQTAGRLATNAAALASLAARQATLATPAEQATLADRIASRERMIRGDLDRLARLGLPAEHLERLRAAHQSMVNSALRLDALNQEIATQRRAGTAAAHLLPLERRRARLLQHQEVVASEMETLLSGLVSRANEQLEAAQNAATERLRLLLAVMIVATGLTALILAAAYVGLRRHLLDRLRALTAALDSWRAGHRPALPLAGPDDELTAMARTLDRLVDAVERQTDDLRLKSITDPLTGALNRRGLADLGGDLLRLAHRYGTPVTVLVGDIDHFKTVNDAHGHPAGDRVLKAVADIWQGALREVDLFGRLGGEEFACVMPHTGEAAALVVAERVRSALGSAVLATVDGAPISCTISIGLAQAKPGEDLTALLSRADVALYRAKKEGRNRTLVASHD